MFADADYQNLAQTLVGIYGDKAVTYAQRNVAALRAGSGDSEQVIAWTRVAGLVERLVTLRQKGRRRGDGAPTT